MLSTNTTNAPSGIERRRAQHLRQNSTPAAFEAPTVQPLHTNMRQQRHQRSGMSLDLRGLSLMKVESSPMEDSTVSNTNTGQPTQHYMQVAQPHSMPQPGFQESFREPSVHQSLSSPRTPQRPLRARSPSNLSNLSNSPPKPPPSEQELKALSDHIQAVYGSCGQVFINILPVPGVNGHPTLLPTPPHLTPQKPSRLSISETVDHSAMQQHFNDMSNINLEPTQSAMAFDFENPEADVGYESSSYYTSDSPSPQSSPRQRPMQPYLEGIQEAQEQHMAFSQAPALFPSPQISGGMGPMPHPLMAVPQPSISPDLAGEASLEYTGISPEEVQRYISEQDPATSKWTCLYPECGKVFGRRENIRSHVQTHLGDRQFRCNGCGKCFVRQHDLKRHAKIHSGNKDYLCPCGSGFARQDALTRHRQRGMCSGGFPDAVRRQAKRGRPKKNRPDMEERTNKASRTRRALASAGSSVSASSPSPEAYSTANTPAQVQNDYDTQPMSSYPTSFGDYSSSMSNSLSNQFSFDSVATSFDSNMPIKQESSFEPSTFSGHVPSFNILQQLSNTNTNNHTPPMSPNEDEERPQSDSSKDNNGLPMLATLPTLPNIQKSSSTSSRSSRPSNQFSTPPTSPAEQKDALEDLFGIENGCSQFEMEMNAMADLTPMDNTPYDSFLDFGTVS